MIKIVVVLVLSSMAISSQAYAAVGLLDSVYHSIPDYMPANESDATIAYEQAYTASVMPTYTFLNANDGFDYNDTNDSVPTYLGADAAGAALTDALGLNYTAFDATGDIVISTAGDYMFSVMADDAARVYVGGSLIVESDYQNNVGPTTAAEFLNPGDYSFELYHYQLGGDAFLKYGVIGPAAVSYITVATSAAPEPGAWSLMIIGIGVIGLGLRASRRKNTMALATA